MSQTNQDSLASSKAAFFKTMRKHPERLKGKSIEAAYAGMRRQVGYNEQAGRASQPNYAKGVQGPVAPKASVSRNAVARKLSATERHDQALGKAASAVGSGVKGIAKKHGFSLNMPGIPGKKYGKMPGMPEIPVGKLPGPQRRARQKQDRLNSTRKFGTKRSFGL
jgi:hypothetical protein